jgi:DNA-binding HxlR family transcriptional regulator
MKNHFGCPVQATSNALAGKWKVLIVWHLGFGSRRFAEIRDLLPGVSEKVLTAQLRELENDGILSRLVTHNVPPRVDYMLSDAGRELIPSWRLCVAGAPNTWVSRQHCRRSAKCKPSTKRLPRERRPIRSGQNHYHPHLRTTDASCHQHADSVRGKLESHDVS